MNLLTENLKKVDMFNDILESLKSENKAISFKNIMDIQKAYYVYSLTTNNDKSSIIVCSNILTANKMVQDLKFISELEVVYFPAKTVVYYDVEAQSRENQNDRMYVMSKINDGTKKIVVTTIDSLMLPMNDNSFKNNESIFIKKDDTIDFSGFVKQLDFLRLWKVWNCWRKRTIFSSWRNSRCFCSREWYASKNWIFWR